MIPPLVLKFGGTSMGNATAIRKVVQIIRNTLQESPCVVVCSAVSGITNALFSATDEALLGKVRPLKQTVKTLQQQHKNILAELLPETGTSVWNTHIKTDFEKLRYVLQGVQLVGDITDKTRAYIVSFGERIAVQILTHYMRSLEIPCEALSANRIIHTDDRYLEANVDMRKTQKAIRRIVNPILQKGTLPIVTGFLGRDIKGQITLLGRGGSDYTAGLLGLCLNTSEIQIWTDVSGIYSANPRYIENTKQWDTIDIGVMNEMAYAGAKVLHPKSVLAAVEGGIQVRIKNTFKSEENGTLVTLYDKPGVYGISATDKQCLLHLENRKIFNSFGFIQSFTEVLVNHRINIDSVSTSETGTTISLPQSNVTKYLLHDLRVLAKVTEHQNLTKFSVIGKNITNDPEILSGIYKLLKNEVILTQCSNASYNTLTIFLQTPNKNRILQIIHNHFFL